jgi:heme oxygenase
MSATDHDETLDTRFSARLRDASWGAHKHAEQSEFMGLLFAGTLPQSAFARLTAQHYFVYRELETASAVMAGDPVAGPFVFESLYRLGGLTTDLTDLYGPDWAATIEPTSVTTEYCDRLRTVAAVSPAGFIAHHYVRYLGDLSGGQIIRRVLEKAYGAQASGTAFYQFDKVDNIQAFKESYRDLLDSEPWPAEDAELIVNEVLVAYDLNARMIDSLPLD